MRKPTDKMDAVAFTAWAAGDLLWARGHDFLGGYAVLLASGLLLGKWIVERYYYPVSPSAWMWACANSLWALGAPSWTVDLLLILAASFMIGPVVFGGKSTERTGDE